MSRKRVQGDSHVELDLEQLEPAEAAELARTRGAVRGNVELISGHAAGLKSAAIYGKHGQNASKMLSHLRAIADLAGETIKQMPLPVPCIVLACVLLTGCCGDGGSRTYSSDAVSNAGAWMPSSGGCADGQCKVQNDQ